MPCYMFHTMFSILATFQIENMIAVTTTYQELILLRERIGRNFCFYSLGTQKNELRSQTAGQCQSQE